MKSRQLLQEFLDEYPPQSPRPPIIAYGLMGTDIDGHANQIAHPRCLQDHNAQAGQFALVPTMSYNNAGSVIGRSCMFCKQPVFVLNA